MSLEEEAGPSTSVRPLCLADSMVRSCSVGYLDLVDAQLVPSEVSLLMLRKEAPKRLVLVNRTKPKANKRHQSRQICRQEVVKNYTNPKSSPNLKNCGKSKSLDSGDLFPNSESIKNLSNLSKSPVVEEEVIAETQVVNKSTSNCQTSPLDNINHCNLTVVDENANKKETKLGFFASRSPLMRRKKEEKTRKNARNVNNKQKMNQIETKNGLPLHTQALANLEKLITRLREDDKPTPPPSPRLPKSSPASPAPSKKGLSLK